MERRYLLKNAVKDRLNEKECGMAEHDKLMAALNKKAEDMLDNACSITKAAGKKRVMPGFVK
jgi:hypothetical protein